MIYRYAHPELFGNVKKVDFSKYSGDLVLYGAGRRGAVAAHALKKRGVEFICFCDGNTAKHGTIFCEHDVISPEQLYTFYRHTAVLVTTSSFLSVKNKLQAMGVSNILDCISLFMEIDFTDFTYPMSFAYTVRNMDFYFDTMLRITGNEKYLPNLYFFITTRCTLRCRECNVKIPFIAHPKDFPADGILSSVKKMLRIYPVIGNISLLGGEPFLHPDLSEMIEQLCEEKQICKVTIITNATIFPYPKLIQAMKHPKVYVRMSDYQELSSNLQNMIDLFEEKNIRYEVTAYGEWNKSVEIKRYDLSAPELSDRFKNCCAASGAVAFCNSEKLYLCAIALIMDDLGILPDSEDNYVKIADDHGAPDVIKKKIISFNRRIQSGAWIDACRYCSGYGSSLECVPVAEQTNELLEFEKLF